MSEESIAKKTISTSIWGAFERIITYSVQFVVTMILARLLSPTDYGIIAMISVFIAISQQFVECGITNALIRKKDCTSVDYSTAFFFNVLIGGTVYILLFLCAPIIAYFYEQEILISVIRIYGLNLIFQSFTLVQNAILTKELKAKRIAVIATTSSLSSGIVGIFFAYWGLGVWALVIQTLMQTIISLIGLWLSTSWRPFFVYSKESLKYLWIFGSKMLVTGIISSVYRNIYSIVIGKQYSMRDAGIFNRGQTLSELMPNIIQGIFVRNTLPIMSQVQDDRARLEKVYREFCILVCLISFPAIFLLCVLAKPFIMFVLTEKWADSIIFVQIFCVTVITYPVNAVNLNLIQVFGRSDIILKAEIFKKTLGFLLVAVMFKRGLLYLAVGGSLMNILSYSVNLYYAKQLVGVSFREQLMDLTKPLLAAIFSAFVAILPKFIFASYCVQLFLGGLLGLLSYVILIQYIFKIELANRIISYILSKQ